MSQGGQANRAGAAFEHQIVDRLLREKYRQEEFIPLLPTDKFFIHQLRGKFISMFGRPWKVDLYVWHPEKHPSGIIIECKYQRKGGSVHEKFPYALANLKANFEKYGVPGLLALSGDGAKQYAVSWCKSHERVGELLVITTTDILWEKFNYELF